MSDNGNKFDMNQLLTLVGVIIALLAVVVTITTPELRDFFGLKDGNTPAPVLPAPTPQQEPKIIPPKIETPPEKPAAAAQQPPVVHEEKEPSGPQEYIIGENKSEFIKEANARLSVSFHDEYKTASITITPAGKQAVVRPVLNGYTEEFTSSTGAFLVHVLNVDWNSRTITVQVSRKI